MGKLVPLRLSSVDRGHWNCRSSTERNSILASGEGRDGQGMRALQTLASARAPASDMTTVGRPRRTLRRSRTRGGVDADGGGPRIASYRRRGCAAGAPSRGWVRPEPGACLPCAAALLAVQGARLHVACAAQYIGYTSMSRLSLSR